MVRREVQGRRVVKEVQGRVIIEEMQGRTVAEEGSVGQDGGRMYGADCWLKRE